jgi:hypothetical protein
MNNQYLLENSKGLKIIFTALGGRIFSKMNTMVLLLVALPIE